MAINSETELMKGEINQTDDDTWAAFTCEYLGHRRLLLLGNVVKLGGGSVLSVKCGFGINIKVTRAASEGFCTLVCLLVAFLKRQINSGRVFRERRPNC